MANRKLQAKNSIKTLTQRLRSKDHVEIRDRIRAVIFALKGRTDGDIADILDCSLGWVKKWISRYSQDGFDGLYDQARPGAPPLLTDKQIAILRDEILAGPGPDDILSRYRISDLVEWVLERFGVRYSPSGMHALMKRMKLSHVKPRPQHPKNDPFIMEDWKKKRRASSKDKVSFTLKKKSKSGIKMKHDSARKVSSVKYGQPKA